MDVGAAIDKALREQTDKEQVIETLWLLFAVHVQIPPGGVQWIESRRCFFGGANLLFECIMRIPSLDWFAGFFDGEGCITIIRGKRGPQMMSPRYRLYATVSNTFKPSVLAFQARFGGNVYRHARYRRDRHICWKWQVDAQRAGAFLRSIKNRLRVKREEAQIGLAFQTIVGRERHRPYHRSPTTGRIMGTFPLDATQLARREALYREIRAIRATNRELFVGISA